jgi:SPP1 family predicted phage head-tail adaptor
MLDVKDIKIGDLDERIEIQTASLAANAQSEQIPTWSTSATVWAKVEYPNASNDENYTEALLTAYRRVQFTVRDEVTVTETNRIVYESENYDILTVQKMGRQGFKVITTELRK